jgi:CTP synthase (UTP-ammonia lyase)
LDSLAPVLNAVHNPAHEVNVALVGKYVDLPDAYLSVTEAIRAGGFANRAKVNIHWVASDDCETLEGAREKLSQMDAICIPGGFGIRGIEGKLGAIRYAREQQIPTLGLCLGLQCMVIEYARSVAGLTDASSTEFDPETPNPVIATMAEQIDVLAGGDMGGTMRLGMFEAKLQPGSLVSDIYESEQISERHRHRYEVNNFLKRTNSPGGGGFQRNKFQTAT